MVYPMQGYGYASAASYDGGANVYLTNLQGKLRQGIIPGLQELGDTFPDMDPNAPQAQQLLIHAVQMLKQVGPIGEIRAKELVSARESFAMNAIKGALMGLGQNADYETRMQLQYRIAAVDNIEQSFRQQTFQFMDQDPAHGGQFNLQQAGGAQPQQGLDFMMGTLMRMMMAILTRKGS